MCREGVGEANREEDKQNKSIPRSKAGILLKQGSAFGFPFSHFSLLPFFVSLPFPQTSVLCMATRQKKIIFFRKSLHKLTRKGRGHRMHSLRKKWNDFIRVVTNVPRDLLLTYY